MPNQLMCGEHVPRGPCSSLYGSTTNQSMDTCERERPRLISAFPTTFMRMATSASLVPNQSAAACTHHGTSGVALVALELLAHSLLAIRRHGPCRAPMLPACLLGSHRV